MAAPQRLPPESAPAPSPTRVVQRLREADLTAAKALVTPGQQHQGGQALDAVTLRMKTTKLLSRAAGTDDAVLRVPQRDLARAGMWQSPCNGC